MSCPWKQDRAAARTVEPVDRAERRRLACTVRADQGDDLAVLDFDGDALQRLDRPVVGVDVLELEDVLRHGAHCWPSSACLPRYASITRLVLLDFLRRPLGDLLAVVEHRDAIGDVHDHAHVVLDHQHRELLFVSELVDEGREVRRLLRVHPGSRLVEQQQLRLRRERASNLESALVAVGEIAGDLVVLVAQAAELQQLAAAIARTLFLATDARCADDRYQDPAFEPRVHTHHDVLERGHVLEQADVLERPADATLSDRVRRAACHVLAVEHDRPDVGL